MGLLRSIFWAFGTNQKHRHLTDYLSAETFDDKITAAEKYLGIWSPAGEERRRALSAEIDRRIQAARRSG